MSKYVDISNIHIPKGFFEGLNVPKLLSWLESLPAADVKEVRHGAWEMIPPSKKYQSGEYVKFRAGSAGSKKINGDLTARTAARRWTERRA